MADRRTFLKSLAGVGAAAATARVAASDRVQVGFIGLGLIGLRHLLDVKGQPDCDVAALCDVSTPRLEEARRLAGGAPFCTEDFRRLLERPLDAVVISTPDHWHALMTILACAAGTDVYVEKPLTHAQREGQWMLEAARRYGRVVQVGTQQRSGTHYARARQLVRDGHIGEVRAVRIGAYRNVLPGFSKAVGEPLTPAQWQLWLGPAPDVPYDPRRGLYHFRWFWDYSGGQTTNLLSHEIDIVQWITGAQPTRAAAFAQRRSLEGIGETPDVAEGLLEYPGFLASWSSREVAAGGRAGLEMYGTRGTLLINRRGFEVVPDREVDPELQIPRFTGPPTGDRPVRYRTEAIKDEGYEQVRDQFVPHVRDFVASIRGRTPPVADLVSGHATATACHLVNIAARVGRVVRWDAQSEQIAGDPEAAALLTKTYRAPWDRELHAALGRAVN